MAILNTRYPLLPHYTLLSSVYRHPRIPSSLLSSLLRNFTVAPCPIFKSIPVSCTYVRTATQGTWLADPSFSNNEDIPIIGSKTSIVNKSNVYNQLINGIIHIILGIPLVKEEEGTKTVRMTNDPSLSSTVNNTIQPIDPHNYTLFGLRTSVRSPSITTTELDNLIGTTISYVNNTLLPYYR